MNKKNKKIMIVSGVSSKKGGSNAAIIENVLYLQDYFTFLVVVPEEGSFSEQLKKNMIPYTIINSAMWRHKRGEKEGIKHSLKKFCLNLIADFKLYKLIKQQNISIVHINVSAIGVGWLAAKLAHIPVLWHLRELNDIDQNYPLDYPKISNFMFRRATLISISEFVSEYYNQILGRKKQIKLIEDGIYTGNLVNITDLKCESRKKFLIGFLGGYQNHKGLSTVLKAIYIIKNNYSNIDIQLVVYGSQYEENHRKYESLVKNYGIDNVVTFRGFTDDLIAVYSSIDIVISAGVEAFGRVAAETIVSGRIIIGSDEGATKYLIDDGFNGYIFEHNNPNSLAKKIIDVSNNWFFFLKNIDESRAINSERFSSEKTSKSIGELYKELIDRSKK